VLLFAFFACICFHFYTRPRVEQSDVIQTRQSSIRRLAPTSKISPPASTRLIVESEVRNSPEKSMESETISEEDLAHLESDDEITSLPWDDIDEGWKNQLKEYLTSVDPEKGEEMFQAYLEEKKKYVERVDFSDSDSTITEDTSADAIIEDDQKEGELERIHVQNLKDIFGDHFPQVESLHKEYVESIQYLNRSSTKFSVTL